MKTMEPMEQYNEDYDYDEDCFDETMDDLIASEYTYGDDDFTNGIDADMDGEDDYW